MRLPRWVAVLFGFVAVNSFTRHALAHRINHISVTIDFAENGSQWTVTLSAEARRILEAKEALSLLPLLERGGESADQVKNEVFERAREYFPERVALYLDGKPLPTPAFEFSLVEVEEKEAVDPGQTQSAGQRKHFFIVGTWSGPLPSEARNCHFELTGDTAGVLIVKVNGESSGPVIPYFPGEKSKSVQIPQGRAGQQAGAQGANESTTTEDERTGDVFARYLKHGFRHILPEGLDHILFVLGLFFLSRKIKPLLWQVTAFTIAHSITLALAMLNIVRLPEKPVEIAIAVSIAFVAIENLWRKDLSKWRPIVVFAFGLIHGLGFAGAFKEMLGETGTPSKHFLTMLVSFNVGVELGQLAVIALAFLAVGWFWKADWYRRRISIPASVVIACFGLYWAVERMM
ncbi:MAG: HupE/UreJ family protein [Verrucomicrobiales bacterium]